MLLPPTPEPQDAVLSSSSDSIVSPAPAANSKYPPVPHKPRGLIPYAYEPALDELESSDEDDFLHDPNEKGRFKGDKGTFPWRGIINISVILILISGLIFLFIFYPIFAFFRNEARNHAIDGNTGNNGTGQAPFL
jgi:hypothetical protein